MRKFQALSLSAALLASLLLGGCANNAASSDAASSDSAASEPEATPEPTPAPPAANRSPVRPTRLYRQASGGRHPAQHDRQHPAVGHCLRRRAGGGRDRGHHRQPDGAVRQPGQHCQGQAPSGPARDLLLQVALPLNAVPVHIDKNIYASNLLNTLAYQDLDGYHIGQNGPSPLIRTARTPGYAEENCWYTTAELINSGLASYGVSLNGDNTPLFQFGERPAVDPADEAA